jgi:hypothetical protein
MNRLLTGLARVVAGSSRDFDFKLSPMQKQPARGRMLPSWRTFLRRQRLAAQTRNRGFSDRLRQPDNLTSGVRNIELDSRPETHGFASLPRGRFALIVCNRHVKSSVACLLRRAPATLILNIVQKHLSILSIFAQSQIEKELTGIDRTKDFRFWILDLRLKKDSASSISRP